MNTSRLRYRSPRRRVPALDARRLRSTWIVAQLSYGTHMRVLLKAAGLQQLDGLRDLMSYAETLDDADAAEQLRLA